MHNQELADYPAGVFDEVVAWLARGHRRRRMAAGVPRDRLIVDPGIGFGKTTADNLELLHRLAELKAALGGLPLLVGTSRKRFIGELLGGAAPDQRLEGTRRQRRPGHRRRRRHRARPRRRRHHEDACASRTGWSGDERRESTRPDHPARDAVHGPPRRPDWEKETAQPFEVDLVLHADLAPAAEPDDARRHGRLRRLFDAGPRRSSRAARSTCSRRWQARSPTPCSPRPPGWSTTSRSASASQRPRCPAPLRRSRRRSSAAAASRVGLVSPAGSSPSVTLDLERPSCRAPRGG